MFINSSLEPHTTPQDHKLWGEVMTLILQTTEHIQKLPQSHWPTLNCHSICRALAICIPEVKVVDGLYLGLECQRNGIPQQVAVEIRNCSHSWLVTPDEAIIDPYPVGIIITNPILIGPKGPRTVFGHQLYFPDSEVTRRVMNPKIHRTSLIISGYMKASMKNEAVHQC
jgi:hypothetical protein